MEKVAQTCTNNSPQILLHPSCQSEVSSNVQEHSPFLINGPGSWPLGFSSEHYLTCTICHHIDSNSNSSSGKFGLRSSVPCHVTVIQWVRSSAPLKMLTLQTEGRAVKRKGPQWWEEKRRCWLLDGILWSKPTASWQCGNRQTAIFYLIGKIWRCIPNGLKQTHTTMITRKYSLYQKNLKFKRLLFQPFIFLFTVCVQCKSIP